MKPKVIHKRNPKLGKMPVWGKAIYAKNPIIELDKNLKGFDHLTILLHECVHLAYPKMREDEVRRSAKLLASVVWSQGYRRIER